MLHQTSAYLFPPKQCFNTEKRINKFWEDKVKMIETMKLPLARVKKVMKLDDQVKEQMISVDVPVLMSKACEMLCERLTLAAWRVTESGKRKTLVKSDIAEAVAADDKLDFLVDIVPRPERHRKIEGRVYLADSSPYVRSLLILSVKMF
uniref:CBFD_NFYB_HMF domain-containing protein n=1 Tax=Syphacia muris TaxID=451379 RepID=A0A0N5ADM1_9BILA